MELYWSLFVAFFKVGFFGYGGGPALIPLIQNEVVDVNRWLTVEEFTDALGMASTLPGPIATKLAVTVGMRTGGAWGAATALFALLLPSTVLVTILAIFYYRYRNAPAVQGALKGIRPVVIALLLVTVAHLSPRSVVSWDTFLIALATFAVVFYLRIHPIYMIVVAALVGFVFYR